MAVNVHLLLGDNHGVLVIQKGDGVVMQIVTIKISRTNGLKEALAKNVTKGKSGPAAIPLNRLLGVEGIALLPTAKLAMTTEGVAAVFIPIKRGLKLIVIVVPAAQIIMKFAG